MQEHLKQQKKNDEIVVPTQNIVDTSKQANRYKSNKPKPRSKNSSGIGVGQTNQIVATSDANKNYASVAAPRKVKTSNARTPTNYRSISRENNNQLSVAMTKQLGQRGAGTV